MSSKAILSVNSATCDGVGMCALVAPALITLDEWGFPVINSGEASASVKKARAAARACPHRALRVEP
ncbi:MAG: ferredoxin [Actinomycetes bacterium]